MKQSEYDKLEEILENAYHKSSDRFNLPCNMEESVYAHNAKDGLRWSCPMKPYEIWTVIANEFYHKIDE